MALGDNLRLRLGAMALALLPAVSLLVLMVRPIWDVDVFWQALLGELTLANHGPLATEPFAVLHLGEPLPAVAWLGQVVMALVLQALGWTGLRLVDALCWLGGFWAAAWAARRAGASRGGTAIALAFALASALPTASLRPQSFAALCFGGLILLSGLAGPAWRRLLLSAPLLVLWQNLHPSVSIAGVWAGVLAAMGWTCFLLRRASPPPWEETALAGLALAAMFLTPDGFGILMVSAANAASSKTMGVSEWLPLWVPINREFAGPLLALAAAQVFLIVGSGRWNRREAAPPLALLLLSLVAYRFVLFWAIAMIPAVARSLAIEREVPAPRWLMPLALLGAVAIVPLALPTRFASFIPLDQIAGLRRAGIRGTIYNHFAWGGALVDAGYPDWHVAFDGRFYRYSSDEWSVAKQIGREPGGLALALSTYHPAAFVIDPLWDSQLIAELRAPGSGWKPLVVDPTVAIFVPDQTGQPQRRPAAISSK